MKDLKRKGKTNKENAEKAEARALAADKRLEVHKAKEAADTKVRKKERMRGREGEGGRGGGDEA